MLVCQSSQIFLPLAHEDFWILHISFTDPGQLELPSQDHFVDSLLTILLYSLCIMEGHADLKSSLIGFHFLKRGEFQVLLKPLWMFLLTWWEFACMESVQSTEFLPFFLSLSFLPLFLPSSHLPLPPRCELFSTSPFFLTGCNHNAFLFSLSPRWHSPAPPWGDNGGKAIQEKLYYYRGEYIGEFWKNSACTLLFQMKNTWTIPSTFTYHLTFSET